MNTVNVYESPQVEIVEMTPGQSVLISSFSGEDINDWEEL